MKHLWIVFFYLLFLASDKKTGHYSDSNLTFFQENDGEKENKVSDEIKTQNASDLVEVKMDSVEQTSLGKSIYKIHCQRCHRIDFTGNQLFGNVPSLVGIENRRSTEEIIHRIQNGKRMMHDFPSLSNKEVNELIQYILSSQNDIADVGVEPRIEPGDACMGSNLP